MPEENPNVKDKNIQVRCTADYKIFVNKLSDHVGLTGRNSDMVRRAVANLAVETGLMTDKESNRYR